MPLQFNNGQQSRIVYNNPITVNDFNSSFLTETSEKILMDTARTSLRNWCFEGFRVGHFVLEQSCETNYEIANNIDAVKIYFNRKGSHQSNYRQVSRKVLLRSGQCNMIYSNELNTHVSHIDKNSEIFTLQFTPNCFLELLEQGDFPMHRFREKVAKKQPGFFSADWLAIDPAMNKCIQDILNCPFRADMKKLYLRSKVIELLLLFAGSADENIQSGIQANEFTDKERLYFVREYLIQNFASPNSLPELAKIAGLNEFKLKKGFKSLFNTSVIDFLINYRLEHAHNLLRNTRKSVSDVAYEAGYTSPSYFGKAFRKKYGFSPKEIS